MTINHVFIYSTPALMSRMLTFYRTSLKPLGYTEKINAFNGTVVGFGSDFPYLWLKQVPEGDKPYATHVAIDAPDNAAVDEFHKLAVENGGTDHGAPGNRDEMSVQPYYAAFALDPQGNNIEAVRLIKKGQPGSLS
ncbi:glyoxalase family protein [Paraphoma chrysanthemicola]|nr:glyoxalase family protein [Paraphoma chrysanthemicola]